MTDLQSNRGLVWGLVGYGDLAQRRLIEALSRPPNRLAAVWGRDLGRAQAFAARFGIPSVAGSLEALIQAVDAVYVAAPPAVHMSIALATVEAGRHVLIEKPMSPTFDGYEELSALVPNKGVRAAVAYYRRFAPAVRRLYQIITAGELGCLQSVELTYARPFNPAPNDPKAWRLNPGIAGGGVLADAGCHRVDLLCWLFGPGRVLDAKIERPSLHTTEYMADMTLAFSGGFGSRCRFSWNDTFADRLVIHGEYGTVLLDPLDQGNLIAETQQGRKAFDFPPPGNLHVDLVQAFGSLVQGEETTICTLTEARLVDEIIETAYRFNEQ